MRFLFLDSSIESYYLMKKLMVNKSNIIENMDYEKFKEDTISFMKNFENDLSIKIKKLICFTSEDFLELRLIGFLDENNNKYKNKFFNGDKKIWNKFIKWERKIKLNKLR